ncbi:MAG: PEP-CTERM sorting domain-containing protein [Planctomycetota bacterium]|nr:PEP-CTERM sorting domain-containing protein [Planctomycetota bacterium]
MLKAVGIVAAVASLFIAGTALGGPYLEQFTGGSAGWLAPTVNNSGGVAMPGVQALLDAAGSGCIGATLTQGPDRLFGFQPADTHLYGDLTGLQMTVDYMALGAVTGPETPMVRFYIGSSAGGANYFVSNDAFSWNPNAGPDWTTHLVDLVAANFLEWPNQAAHSKTFEQVLAAPDDIGLVFSGAFTSNSTLGFSGSGTILIDNFGVVGNDNRATMATPEPATLALLACGGAWLLAWRRKAR